MLTRIPYIGKYFRLYNTLIHEIGHAVMSVLTKGEVYHIKIYSDTSGEAFTGSRGKIAQVLVSIVGYPFSIAVAVLMIDMLHQGKSETILYGLIAVMVFSLLFWVRNWFGFIWLAVSVAASAILLLKANEQVIDIYVKVLVGIFYVESIVSTLVIFVITIRDRKNAGDSRNLKHATGIPEIVWSILFVAFAVASCVYTMPKWF